MIPSDVNYPLDALFILIVLGPSVEFPSQHRLEMAEMESELLHHFLQSHRHFFVRILPHVFTMYYLCCLVHIELHYFFLQQ